MSDRTKKPKPFRYPREVDADELDALEADGRRWRTVERAVEKNVFVRLASGEGTSTVTIRDDGNLRPEYFVGPTLAAAVDKLQERMDKEAK